MLHNCADFCLADSFPAYAGLMGQQPCFDLDTTVIACQSAVCADHPVTGDDNAYGIMVICTANCTDGPGASNTTGLLSIGNGLPIGNGLQGVPTADTEIRAIHEQGQVKNFQAASKISGQLADCFLQKDCLRRGWGLLREIDGADCLCFFAYGQIAGWRGHDTAVHRDQSRIV